MDDEAAIVSGLRAGDARAFDRAYAAFSPRIRAFLLRLSRRSDVADDLAQETWLKLARSAPTLAEDTRLAAFLFTIARNAFLSHRRWSLLDVSRLFTLANEEETFARSPEEHAEVSQATRAAEIALGRLGADDRELLLLVGVEGFSHEEVAAMLSLTDAAMRKRLSRARERLAAEISRETRSPAAIRGGSSP